MRSQCSTFGLDFPSNFILVLRLVGWSVCLFLCLDLAVGWLGGWLVDLLLFGSLVG